MVKQNASIDASFWINACAGDIVEYVTAYFYLFSSSKVAEEIRYPLNVLDIKAFSAVTFNQWIREEKITLQAPIKPVDWFDAGENEAIALAIENRYWLLMDDANPFHYAKSQGLSVIGTMDFTILLYDHGHIDHDAAINAIKQMRTSKRQKRQAMTVLERLIRNKDG